MKILYFKKITALIVAVTLLLAQVVSAGENSVEAYIVDRSIIYPSRGNLGLNEEYPVLSYNDRTYVSARLVAETLGYDAVYNGDKVYFRQPPEEKYVVKSEKMALNLGKAIIAEYFSDRITDSTCYIVSMGVIPSLEFYTYCIIVKFNVETPFNSEDEMIETMLATHDARVVIDPANGEILEIYYFDEQGQVVDLI